MSEQQPSSHLPTSTARAIERFELAWQGAQPPAIEQFLPPVSQDAQQMQSRRELLVELVLVDLEYRWKRADLLDTVNRSEDDSAQRQANTLLSRRPRLEEYLQAFTELGTAEALELRLVTEEYRVRHRWGDRPSHAEYATRFPALAGHPNGSRGNPTQPLAFRWVSPLSSPAPLTHGKSQLPGLPPLKKRQNAPCLPGMPGLPWIYLVSVRFQP